MDPKPPVAKPGEHVVVLGDTMALIAARNGFRDYRVIWNHPDNAALKKQRPNPHSLAPGDVVRIPQREPADFTRGTNVTHRFEAAGGPTIVNLLMENQGHEPFAERAGNLRVAGFAPSGAPSISPFRERTTGSRGDLIIESERSTLTNGEFIIPPPAPDKPATGASFRFLIGQLQPLDTPPGMRARLSNLGYFAGASDRDVDQLAWAVEEFQCDEKMPKAQRGFDPTNRARMLPTLNKLGLKHGDLLPGEELAP